MDETKQQSADLHELPEGDLDLDLSDLDLDLPDVGEDPALPIVEDNLSDGDDLPEGLTGESPVAEFEAGEDWEFSGSDFDGDDMSLDPPAGDSDVPAADPMDLAPLEDEEDLQPVALSEAELENILGSDTEEAMATPEADAEGDVLGQDFAEMPGPDDGLEMSDDVLALDDDSDSSDDVMAATATADDADEVEHEELTPISDDLDLDFEVPADGPLASALSDDDDDDEPITLSEDELGSILDDVEPSDEMVEGVALGPDASASAPAPLAEPAGVEEDITLTDDELNQVLLDGDVGSAAAPQAEAPSLLDDEDDEPITLTPEELGNIVADADQMDAAPSAEAAPVSILDSEDDEGPVALSENELDAILEDVDDAPMMAAGEPVTDDDLFGDEPAAGEEHVIVLDEYDDEIAAAAAVEAEKPTGTDAAIVDRAAEAAGVNKEELKKVISYLDNLFDQLPDSTVEEFSRSEYFELYRKVMSELGL